MNISNEVDLFSFIQSEIDNNTLILPTLPNVALKVQETLNSDNATTQKLADIIATDAALSARFMQVANSALYRRGKEVTNLSLAINRLGQKLVKSLVFSLSMRQAFKPRSKILASYFQQIWEQSVNVSSISRALATRIKHLDKEQALLGGLIYQIGKLPILMVAEQAPKLAADPNALQKVLDNLHPEIGKMIMDSWEFPEALKPVVYEYSDFRRHSGTDADYVDVVQVAHIQNSIEFRNNSFNLAEIESFSKLGLDTEIEVLEIEGVAEEVQDAKILFS